MFQKNIALLSLISFLLLGISTVLAQPEISSVTGTMSHKETIVINGFGFGGKTPAKPLVWDDCEDYNDGDDPVVDGPWDQGLPSASGSPHDISYRIIPYEGVPAPHRYSSIYVTGAHYPRNDYDEGYNDPLADQMLKDAGLEIVRLESP